MVEQDDGGVLRSTFKQRRGSGGRWRSGKTTGPGRRRQTSLRRRVPEQRGRSPDRESHRGEVGHTCAVVEKVFVVARGDYVYPRPPRADPQRLDVRRPQRQATVDQDIPLSRSDCPEGRWPRSTTARAHRVGEGKDGDVQRDPSVRSTGRASNCGARPGTTSSRSFRGRPPARPDARRPREEGGEPPMA